MISRKRLRDIDSTPENHERYRRLVEGFAAVPIELQPNNQSSLGHNAVASSDVQCGGDSSDLPDLEQNVFEFKLPDNFDNGSERIVAFDDPPEQVVDFGDYEDDSNQADDPDESDSESEEMDVDSLVERPTLPNRVEAILIAFMNQIKSNQTDEEASRNAQMINMGFIPPLIKSTDVRCMRKKVPNAFNPKIRKYFYPRKATPQCDSLIGPVFDLKKPANCVKNHPTCRIQNPSTVVKEDGSFFCYAPVSEYLQHIIPIRFHELRLVTNSHSNSPYLHDLPDGSIYKQIVNPKADYPTLTITLTWDGVETTKQGTKSIWPLCAFLNELPFNIRIYNGMLIALHAGSSKPDGDLMFRPLIDELEVLQHNPITIKIGETQHRFYVKLLLFIADGPARAVALNCGGHTCKYGCHMCDTEFDYDSTFKTPIFKTPNVASIKYRDEKTWNSCVQKALEAQGKTKNKDEVHHHGIKGPCELMRLNYIKLNRLFPPEALHSMYEGNVKSILRHWLDLDLLQKAWFSNLIDSAKQTYKMRHLLVARCKAIDEIDKSLSKIKFPSRSLCEMPKLRNRGQFKSLDYELLVFYGCVCFKGIIKESSLNNFMLFALILSKLSAQNVKRDELNFVRRLVDQFLKSFEDIYGNDQEKYMWRSNLHHVAHLCDIVEWYGPLFIQSAYFTESLMGELKRKIVSGTNISQQGFNKCTNQYSVLGAVMTLAQQPNTSTRFMNCVENLYPSLAATSVPISVSKVYHDPDMRSYATMFDASTIPEW